MSLDWRSAPRGCHPARVRDRLTAVHLSAAVVVAVWAALYLHGLGEIPLRVWDESRYAAPARHMAAGSSWLDPVIRVDTHGGELALAPRLSKPPLVYWLQAASMSALGATTFAARLPSALAALGCAGVVFHVARGLSGHRAAVAGALVFLVFPGMLLGSHGGRAAVTDPVLTLFGSCFVWLTWRGRERPRLLVPAGVFAGLAVMTKGVAAGAFVVAVAPALVYCYRRYLTPWTAAAVGSTLLVALPWHLYAWVRYRGTFVEQYFVTAVLSRAGGEMREPPVEPLFEFMNYPYIRSAVAVFLPPYPHALVVFGGLVAGGAALIVRRLRRDGVAAHATWLFVVWWAAAAPLTYSVAGGNHAWYLMPMYVPGAVVAGDAVATATGWLRRRWGQWGQFQSPGPRVGHAAYVGACVLVATLLVASFAPPPTNDFAAEQETLGEAVAAEVPDDATIAVLESVERQSLMSLSFYADRSLRWTTLDEIQTDSGVGYAIVPLDARDSLEREHRMVVEGPTNGIVVVAFTG